MYLSILKETFIVWGIKGIMYIYNMYLLILNEAFITLGIVFGIMYIYLYVSFNIKRGFYYLRDSVNYVYIYMYLSILRGFYYFGGNFWRCVFIHIK